MFSLGIFHMLVDFLLWNGVAIYHFIEIQTFERKLNSINSKSIEVNKNKLLSNETITYMPNGTLSADYYIKKYEKEHGVYQKKREIEATFSSIEGSSAESLLSSLQKDLEENDEGIETDEESIEPSEINIEIEEGDKEEEKQKIEERLAMLSKKEGVEHLQEIVLLMHKLYELDGRYEDMEWLETQHKDIFFPIEQIGIDPVPEKVTELATATIQNSLNEGCFGKIVWVGRVIGKSAEYIHFADTTSRTWLHIGDRVKKVKRNDVLVLLVEIEDKNTKYVHQILRIKEEELISQLVI